MTQDSASDRRSFWQAGANSVAALRRGAPNDVRRGAVVTFFTFEVIFLTFFQKFAIPLNLSPLGIGIDLGTVEAVLPLTYIAMILLFTISPLKIELNRLILFSIFTLFTLISIFMLTNSFSSQSLLLFLAINIPFIFYIEVSPKTYRQLIQIYLNIMIFFGVVVIVQYAMEIIWTWKTWPNLDKIIPDIFRFVGYNYIQSIRYGSRLMKPNGIFFLEVSYVSQWTAIALALELVYFRRIWRMIFYSSIILSLFAGTGILLLAICSPVLLSRVSWKSISGVVAVFAICAFIAVQINWYQQVNHRFTEYKTTGSSSNHRFIEPFEVLKESLGKKNIIFAGEGPGNIAKGGARVWWAVTKLTYEYGVLTTLSFYAFYCVMLFSGAPSLRIAVVLFVLFNFMAGFSIPVYPFLIYLLGGLFRIKNDRATI